jgi:hypothetical protein
MTERAELGSVVSERLRAGGLSGTEGNALGAACEPPGTDFGARERSDERLAILLAWLDVSSGPTSISVAPMTSPSRRRGCRTSTSQSARWLNGTHNHAGDDLAVRAAGGGENVGRDRSAVVTATDRGLRQSRPNRVWDALPPLKDYVSALDL